MYVKEGAERRAPQIIEQSRAYVRSQLPFGLRYLEHEPLHFTAPTGRLWKVYGSPVSCLFSRSAIVCADGL